MADVTLWGASYSSVPSVLLPKTGGGTESFVDVTATTAVASDVASGKIFFTANGTQTTGTGSGGGGLVYESGIYTPTEDIAQPTINFTNSHTDRPFIVIMQDMSGSSNIATQNSNLLCAMVNWYDFSGDGVYGSSSSANYAKIQYIYKTNGIGSSTATITSLTGTNSSSISYWLSNTSFKPGSASTSRYWRKNRTYKWIAVWKP